MMSNPGRHLAMIRIGPSRLADLMRTGGPRRFFVSGVPPDAKCLRLGYDPLSDTFIGVFEHESFPECPEGEIPANVTILHTHLPETSIDMLLFCPVCHMQHVDEPKGEWTNPPHKSHLCRVEDGGCGTIFRPADVATNGVRAIQTSGQNDTWRMTRHAI